MSADVSGVCVYVWVHVVFDLKAWLNKAFLACITANTAHHYYVIDGIL